MKYNRNILFVLVIFCLIAGIIFMGCNPKAPADKGGKKATGLVETPEMLYKSFRAAGAKAFMGEAPELAADVDLSPYFPAPGNQGQIGSCTAWATAYAAKSFQENVEREWGADADERIFSPSFIYNQINGGLDMGAPVESAVAVAIKMGVATLKTMPYTEDYRQQPTQAAFSDAMQYKAKSFARVDSKNLEAVKRILTDGNPVLIGMMLYDNFYNYSGGVYNRTEGFSIGGHAMCVVGYDDTKKAFKIINSWGTYWGEQGYLWVDYEIFKRDVVTALVMYDEITTNPKVAEAPVELEASSGGFPDKVKVTWQSAAYAESYGIYRSENPSEYFKKVGETRGTAFIDTKAIAGKPYFYAVSSYTAAGKESSLSESVKGFAGSIDTELGIPQGLEGVFDTDAVYLSWSPVISASGYYVYRFDREAKNYLRIGETADAGFKDMEKFQNKDILWYIVTAFKGDKESKSAPPATITIEMKAKFLKPPRKLEASRGLHKDKVEISWREVEGAEKYKLYKYYVDIEKWKLYKELDGTSFTDTETNLLQAYYIVTATNSVTVSGPSEPAWGYVLDYGKNVKSKKYDDEAYYNDTNYFKDTDYKKDTKYKDDKTTGKKETYNRFDDREAKREAEREAERKDTEAFFNDETGPGKISSEEEVLDSIRDKITPSVSDPGKSDKEKKNEAAAQNLTKDEMSKSDEEFMADDPDFFKEDSSKDTFSGKTGNTILNNDNKSKLLGDEEDKDFFDDSDDDFFSDDEDF